MATQPCVGVFWDLENCSIPSGMTGDMAADRIRAAIAHFGNLVELNAYGDVNLSAISKKQGELRSAGVCLIHTPHNSKKQVADMHIIADIIAFALDRSEPVTAILISGDGDFAHAVSVLQDRGHSVWIISPHFTTSGKLSCRADGMMSWRYDVLERTDLNVRSLSPSHFADNVDEVDEVESVLCATDSETYGTKAFNCGFGETLPIESWPVSARQTSSRSYTATTRPVSVQSYSPPAVQGGQLHAPASVVTSSPLPDADSLTTPALAHPVQWIFFLLIKVLRELRAADPENTKQLRRHEVVKILQKRDPSVFADYKRPKTYMLKAQSAGVIYMRKEGKGAPQFVYLHPDYY